MIELLLAKGFKELELEDWIEIENLLVSYNSESEEIEETELQII